MPHEIEIQLTPVFVSAKCTTPFLRFFSRTRFGFLPLRLFSLFPFLVLLRKERKERILLHVLVIPLGWVSRTDGEVGQGTPSSPQIPIFSMLVVLRRGDKRVLMGDLLSPFHCADDCWCNEPFADPLFHFELLGDFFSLSLALFF